MISAFLPSRKNAIRDGFYPDAAHLLVFLPPPSGRVTRGLTALGRPARDYRTSFSSFFYQPPSSLSMRGTFFFRFPRIGYWILVFFDTNSASFRFISCLFFWPVPRPRCSFPRPGKMTTLPLQGFPVITGFSQSLLYGHEQALFSPLDKRRLGLPPP